MRPFLRRLTTFYPRRIAIALCLLAGADDVGWLSVDSASCMGAPAAVEARAPGARRIALLPLRGGAPARRPPASTDTPARAAREKRTQSRQPTRLPVEERVEASGRNKSELEEAKAGGGRAEKKAEDGEEARGRKRNSKLLEDSVVAEAGGHHKQRPGTQTTMPPPAAPTSSGRAALRHKRASSTVVTGEYFRKALRAAEAAAADDEEGSSVRASGNVSAEPFRPGAADAVSEDSGDAPVAQRQGANTLEPAVTRSAFVPVIFDDVVGRAPVRERDEWLELFRSMKSYTNIIDLKFVKSILESTGVQCVDKDTYKFAGFLVDAYICRVCSYAADWARLRLQGEEEMKEAAARGSSRGQEGGTGARVLERMRRLNFTLLESDVLHALNEISPGADLPYLEHAILPRGAAAAEAASSTSSSQPESESLSQPAPHLDQVDPAAEAEEDGELNEPRASYIDAGAALEMARFGLSRKQMASLDVALEQEKQEEEKRKLPHVMPNVGPRSLDSRVSEGTRGTSHTAAHGSMPTLSNNLLDRSDEDQASSHTL